MIVDVSIVKLYVAVALIVDGTTVMLPLIAAILSSTNLTSYLVQTQSTKEIE